MSGSQIRFACQTYSWQMSLARYQGRLSHIAGVVSDAGFAGLEPETVVLGPNWSAKDLRHELDTAKLDLAALCLVGRWRDRDESNDERSQSDAVLDAVLQFPDAIVNLVMYPGDDRTDLRVRQDNGMSCMAQIAARGAERGVTCSFHPNSPHGSVFRTRADYDYLLAELDPLIGFTPDVGHLAAGGMDPIAMIRDNIERVRHVHIKDIDAAGAWAPTGRGVLDIPGIVNELLSGGYDGWIAFEDESSLAQSNPDRAVSESGRYVHDFLAPLLSAEARTTSNGGNT